MTKDSKDYEEYFKKPHEFIEPERRQLIDMTLSFDEFLRRFLLHLLPKGFVRIRHFGFIANRRRAALLPLCFQLLGVVAPPQTEPETSSAKQMMHFAFEWSSRIRGPSSSIKITAGEFSVNFRMRSSAT